MPQVTVLPIPPLAHETHYGSETLVFSQRPANFPEFAIAAIGISLLGAILVPLNTRLTTQELLFMLDRSGTSVLITSICS